MPAGCVLAMCAWPRPKVARRARPRPVGWALEVAQMATFILVHGSWHGAWCWHKVTAALEAAGHRVIVPDLPAHGRAWRFPRGRITLAAMTRTVTRILDSLDEPAILVAHSRGGIVASQAAGRRPTRIRAL